MTFPGLISWQSAAAPKSTPASSATTSVGLNVSAGDSVYIVISYATNSAGTLKVSSVSDSSGNTYLQAGHIRNTTNSPYPAQEIWYSDNVPANSSLTVTVQFTSSTFFVFTAMDISGSYRAGSLDAVTTGSTGSSSTTSDSITTATPYDLVIACLTEDRGGSTSSSSGGFALAFTQVSGSADPGDVDTYVYIADGLNAGSYNSSISTLNSTPYAIQTLAIKINPSAWVTLSGKPFVTVSPRGIANSLATLTNDGADFGPDTSGTTTSGIQEALNSIASSGGLIYCLNGTFNLSSPLINTGSNQDVVFAPGSTVVFAEDTTPYTTGAGFAALIVVGTNNGTSPTTYENYSHCRWLGFGASINANLAGATSGSGGAAVFGVLQAGLYEVSGGIAPGEDIAIEGFAITNLAAQAVAVSVENFTNIVGLTNPTYDYQISEVRVSRLTVTWPSDASGGAFGIFVIGSARALVIEDCTLDASAVGSSHSRSVLAVTASSGECEEIRVSRSTFKASGHGNCLLLQANTAFNTSGQRSLHEVLIEDCIFDSGYSSGTGYQGNGGGLITDDGIGTVGTYPGFVYNLEFRRCYFVNAGITSSTQTSGASQFGYLRFTDGTTFGGFDPSGTELKGRGPADSGLSYSSGSPYNLPVYGFSVRLIVNPGSAVGLAVKINGTNLGGAGGAFIVRPGDTANLTWTSGTPTIVVQAL
jgi:hypothetical protein